MKIYIAEFDKKLLALLSALAEGSPLELFSNPVVYLHDLSKETSCSLRVSNATELQASIQNVAFAYNEKLGTTQIVMFLRIEGTSEGFVPYASLSNDAYSSASLRRFGRSLCTALVERSPAVTLRVITVEANSKEGGVLMDTFSALDYNSLV